METLVKIGIRDYGTNPGPFNFPWCAAWLNRVLDEAGIKHADSLMARSYLQKGAETTTPKLGDIVVLWRVEKAGPWGHVGLFIAEDNTNVWLLGGNQDNEVNITRYPKYRVLGYRTFNA